MCVFLSQLFCTQIASFLCNTTLSSVACLAERFSYTLPHKRHNFCRGDHKMRVLIFSTTVIPNILRRVQWDIIINVHGLPVKYPLFLSDFIETWIFSTDFRKTQISNFVKICSVWYFLFKRIYVWCLSYMTYLSNAIGLTPGGSGTVHIYTQTIHRTTQIITEQHK